MACSGPNALAVGHESNTPTTLQLLRGAKRRSSGRLVSTGGRIGDIYHGPITTQGTYVIESVEVDQVSRPQG